MAKQHVPSRRDWRSAFLGVILAAGLSVGPAHNGYGQSDAAADALAEKMLQAIGGREAWANLKNTVNGSQQNRASEPTVVYAVITMDFEQARFRIETTAEDLHLIRVINGDRSWRLRRSGKIEDVPADRVREELKWYDAHLYRTIHRIATRDPAISLEQKGADRLEVFAGGTRILWLRVDEKGEPYAFGAYEDDVGSLSGPWDFIQQDIRHPAWTSSADGTWRAALKSLSVNVPLSDLMFARPSTED